ncbi:MAG: beta-ketoacyl-ACP synthase III, partial [Polyangiaceae bacterium]
MPEALQPPRSRILGTGHYLPSIIRTNLDLEKLVDTSDTWIRERTGIRERRVAPEGVNTSDMAAEAAKRALDAAGLKASDLDMIIVATVTPDMPMPATAVFVQQKLGALNCPAFDISAACAGFIFGLSIADKFISTGAMKHVLVIGVELLSRVIDWSDRTTCVLFGDGAGAVIVGAADPNEVAKGKGPSGILSTKTHSDGSLAHSLMIPGGGSVTPASHEVIELKLNKVKMKGQDIFKAAVRNLYSACQQAVDVAGMKNDEVDWVCPHQANLRIIDQVVQRANYAREKVLSNIEHVGNTS